MQGEDFFFERNIKVLSYILLSRLFMNKNIGVTNYPILLSKQLGIF